MFLKNLQEVQCQLGTRSNKEEQNMHVHERQKMAFMASFPCFNTVFIFTTMKSFVFSESYIFSGRQKYKQK